MIGKATGWVKVNRPAAATEPPRARRLKPRGAGDGDREFAVDRYSDRTWLDSSAFLTGPVLSWTGCARLHRLSASCIDSLSRRFSSHPMRRKWHQRGLRLLLAAAVLLGGVVPPGVCHAHAEGGRPHQHDSSNDRQHRADRPAQHAWNRPAHDLHRDRHRELRKGTVHDSVPHFHVDFLGFELTLPMAVRHKADEPSQPYGGLCLIDMAPGDAPVAAVSSELSGGRLRWPSSLPRLLEHHGYQADVRSLAELSAEASSIPLCDSARGERSGVLRI